MRQLLVEYARKNKPRLHAKENSNILLCRYTCKRKQSMSLNTGDIQYYTCNASVRVLMAIVVQDWLLKVFTRIMIRSNFYIIEAT